MNLRRRVVSICLLSLAILAATVSPAFASHFRGSSTAVSYSNGVITWNLHSAWRKDDIDDFITSPSDVTITDSNSVDVTSSVTVGQPTSVQDQSNPLYALTDNSVTLDINGLLGTPGTYQAYVSDCCRISGVQNTNSNDDFSQAISFTVNANGSVGLPPAFNTPALYKLTPVSTSGMAFTVDYTATDPQGSAITYTRMTDTNGPDWGATVLPCSSFANGILTVSPQLCTGGQVYTDDYQPGFYFASKVRATDAAGNHSEVDTLLHIPTAPQPFINDSSLTGSTASFDVGANDTVVDHYTVTCTNANDPADVHSSAATPSSPVSVTGLSPSSTYNCSVSATNGVGTGTSDPADATQIVTPAYVAQTITFPAVANTHLAVGTVHLSATASSGLPVAYTTNTPTVCTVNGVTATLHALGSCTIKADQAGNGGYATAPQVTRSFQVLPASPTAAAVTSTGVGTALQTATLRRPAGGSVTLLAGASAKNSVAIDGQGTYALNPATGVVTFSPVLGFSGPATPIQYRVTDSYHQTGIGTYTPTVTKPAPPVVKPVHTTGSSGKTQQTSVKVPVGGSVSLISIAGKQVDSLVFADQGTYTLVPTTGVITFTPVDGFSGTAAAITYQVTDAYGQRARALLDATTAAPPTAPVVTTTVTSTPVPTAALAETGSPIGLLAILGLLLLALGSGATVLARPQKR